MIKLFANSLTIAPTRHKKTSLAMRFSNDFCDFGFNLNHSSVILSGQDTRFFPERLTGAVGKGFLMAKAVANL
jgi:hypothetical protein